MSGSTSKVLFENLIAASEKQKHLLSSVSESDYIGSSELEEAFRQLTAEWKRNPNIYMESGYNIILERTCLIFYSFGYRTPGRSNHLDTFQTVLLQFLAAQLEVDCVRAILRDEYNLLCQVSGFFHHSLLPESSQLVLSVLERLSSGFVCLWKPTEVTNLIRNINTYILNQDEGMLTLLLALECLINISQGSTRLSLAVRQADTAKEVVRRLKTFESAGDMRLRVLACHVVFLLEPTLPVEALQAGTEFIVLAMVWICEHLANGKTECTTTTLRYLVNFTNTLARKMESFIAMSQQDNTPCLPTAPSQLKITGEILQNFAKMRADVLSILGTNLRAVSAVADEIMVVIIDYLMALLPTFLPAVAYPQDYMTVLTILESMFAQNLSVGTTNSSTIQFARAYHLIACQVFKTPEVMQEFQKHLLNWLNNSKLIDSAAPDSVELNLNTIQLLNLLLNHSSLAAKVLQKLDVSIIRSLVENLASEENILESIQRRRSVCLLHLLSLMTKYSQNEEISKALLGFVALPIVSNKIAQCLADGDEVTVRMVLIIAAATVLAENSCNSLAGSIVRHRMKPPPSPERTLQPELSLASSEGILKLDQKMRSFMGTSTANSTCNGLTDFFTWVKINEEIAEEELSVIKREITHIRKTNIRLKSLVDGQRETLAKFMAEKESEKLNYFILQSTCIRKENEYESKASLMEKKFRVIEGDLKTKEDLVLKQEASMDKLQNENVQLKAQCLKTEKEMRDECRKSKATKKQLETIEKELQATRVRVSELEASLRIKEDEATTNRTLFENERRKLEIVRGVIGSNYGVTNGNT